MSWKNKVTKISVLGTVLEEKLLSVFSLRIKAIKLRTNFGNFGRKKTCSLAKLNIAFSRNVNDSLEFGWNLKKSLEPISHALMLFLGQGEKV